jgi:hypothetical protein
MKLLLSASNNWDPASNEPKNTSIAFHAISINVSESVRDLIIDCYDAPAAWKLLSAKWAGKSIPLQLQTLKTLFSFNLTSEDPQPQLNMLADYKRTLLAATGSKDISIDDLISLVCLSSISNTYPPLAAVLENHFSTQPLDMHFMAQRINLEYSKSASESSSSALQTSSKCSHGRFPPCWTCHPNLRPTCKPCKDSGKKRFYHHHQSKFCPDKPEKKLWLL